MHTYHINAYCGLDENVALFRVTEKTCEPAHTHDCAEIVYIVSGSGEHTVDEHSYRVSGGSLIFINYGQIHAFHTDEELTYYNILIKPEAVSDKIINEENAFAILSLTAFEDLRLADTSCPFIRFEGEERLNIENIITEMHREFTKKSRGFKAVLRGYLTVLLTYVFRRMVPTQENENAVLSDIIEYISCHFHEKLSLDELSQKCFYSPKYFSHIFKECYGITVTDYIKKTRLENGKRLLRETTIPIDEVSRIVGYNDSVRFYKYFKEYYGMTPNRYRKESQQ